MSAKQNKGENSIGCGFVFDGNFPKDDKYRVAFLSPVGMALPIGTHKALISNKPVELWENEDNRRVILYEAWLLAAVVAAKIHKVELLPPKENDTVLAPVRVAFINATEILPSSSDKAKALYAGLSIDDRERFDLDSGIGDGEFNKGNFRKPEYAVVRFHDGHIEPLTRKTGSATNVWDIAGQELWNDTQVIPGTRRDKPVVHNNAAQEASTPNRSGLRSIPARMLTRLRFFD